MPKNNNISMSVIKRLPRYFRFLGELKKQGIERISSRELSGMMGFTASQIRQDLNCFGGFGQQGYGYNVEQLRIEIGNILGVNNNLKAILIGAGNLGKAVASHMSFRERGFDLIGIFDSDIHLKGQKVNDLTIMHTDGLRRFCLENEPCVAVLCIPSDYASNVVSELISMGIKNFWNFSHFDIAANYPGTVTENVHLSDSLMTLSFQITHKDESGLLRK